MKVSIINGWLLEISIDKKILYKEINTNENLSLILSEYLPPLSMIKEIYLYTGPGSLTGVRNVIAFILGLTVNNKNIKIFYIDIVKDWYLKNWPDYKIIIPFTKKKFLVGYWDNEYKYYFIDNLLNIPSPYWIDYSIKKFPEIICDENKIKQWNSNNLLECTVENNNFFNIIEYKIW